MKKILWLLIAVILITETTLAGYSSSRSYWSSSRSYSSPSRSSSSYSSPSRSSSSSYSNTKSYSSPSKVESYKVTSPDVRINTVKTKASVKNILNDTKVVAPKVDTKKVEDKIKDTKVVTPKVVTPVKTVPTPSVSTRTITNNNSDSWFSFWNYVFFWTLLSNSNNASSNNTISNTWAVTPLTETKVVEKDFSIIEWCKSLFN
jgi:cytoskeletal protein RodZ